MKYYCKICGKQIGIVSGKYGSGLCHSCASKGIKRPYITKVRKGKHFEDFISKKKAKLWKENISKATKGRKMSEKHKKIISKLFKNKPKSKKQKLKLKKAYYKYIKNHKKDFLQRYENRKLHNKILKKLINDYINQGFEILDYIIPDIIIRKNNKIYAIELEKYWKKSLNLKIKKYKKLNLFDRVIFYDFNLKIRKKL